MKKFLKKENGITLVALIITVVILLILATTAITSIKDNKIISNAEIAVDKYNDKVKEEEEQNKELLEILDKETGGNTATSCSHIWSSCRYYPYNSTSHQVCSDSSPCTLCGYVDYGHEHSYEACERNSSGVCIKCGNDGSYVS